MFKVFEFGKKTFIEACTSSVRTEAIVSSKSHTEYLLGYLEHLGCKTILVEPDYVDRDFLDDFAAYYVRCFSDYSRFCTRLHFFSEPFSQLDVQSLVQQGVGLEPEIFKRAYLGHIVLKPLPNAFFGRTCLATYAGKANRHYPMTRSYEAHLAGMTLNVESVAFQEQDTILAACATSALWSALQKAARLFGARVPTTAEITGAAGKNSVATERILPSRGLNVYQMCQAIREAGLDFELREGENLESIRGIIYGYGVMGIPAVIGINLSTARSSDGQEGRNEIGAHAVTVTGFSLKGSTPVTFTADRMEKLFVHDDQVGPFARSRILDDRTIESSFPHRDGPVTGAVTTVIIPVDKKIRIRYEEARDAVIPFVHLLSAINNEYEWSVFLDTINGLRSEILPATSLSAPLRERVLSDNWPKYIWRAKATLAGQPMVEVVMDATDIHRSHFIEDVLFYDKELAREFKNGLKNAEIRAVVLNRLGEDLLLQVQTAANR